MRNRRSRATPGSEIPAELADSGGHLVDVTFGEKLAHRKLYRSLSDQLGVGTHTAIVAGVAEAEGAITSRIRASILKHWRFVEKLGNISPPLAYPFRAQCVRKRIARAAKSDLVNTKQVEPVGAPGTFLNMSRA